MLCSNHRPSRYFTGYARFILALGSLALAIAPLAAQTEAVPDPSAPPADTTPPLYVPAKPVTPTPPQTSAATVVSDSSTPDDNALLSAAGQTPNVGPGAPLASSIGSQLSSSALNQKLPFRITATIGETYSNNIFAQKDKQGDFITHVAVRGEYQVGNILAPDGNFFDLVYSPSLHVYARHSHETGVDQYVDALYGHHWTKLTLTLEQSYTKTQETDTSVGGLVTADVYTTTAKANYAYSEKFDIYLTGRQTFTDYNQPGYVNSKEWAGDAYALYHIDDKLSVGFGPTIGYVNLDGTPDETYEQVGAHLAYVPSDKFRCEAVAGGEDRQYQSIHLSDTLEPIFSFTGTYLPNPSTKIDLNALRRFQPDNNFLGQSYILTNVNLAATQRFFQAYYLGLGVGYENDDYQKNADVPGTTREDNYFYLQPSLTWKANGWLEVAAFDRYEEDISNLDYFSYDTNQVGVSISATY